MCDRCLSVGDYLDARHRVVRFLGLGAMGAVWQVRHESIERDFAAKVLTDRLATDPEAVARFRREARAMGRIQHRSVLAVYDVATIATGRRAGAPYILTELLDGCGLDVMLRSVTFPNLQFTLGLLRALASALDAAHQLGIIHRDVKPANIFLHRARGAVVPKLLDFGISRILSEERITAANSLVGSPAYMSPEQIRGDEVTGQSDVWALGLVFYRCLFGRLPRRIDGDRHELMRAIATEPPPQIVAPELPCEIVSLLSGMMAFESRDRISAGEVARVAASLTTMPVDRASGF